MSDPDNCYWFHLVAETIAEHVKQLDGAIKVQQADYREFLVMMEPRLAHCPETVWEHYRLAFKRHGLHVRSYTGLDDTELLIYNDQIWEKFDVPNEGRHRQLAEQMARAVVSEREERVHRRRELADSLG